MLTLKEHMKDLHQYHKDASTCSTCIHDEEAEYLNYCDYKCTNKCLICGHFYCESYEPITE